MSLSLFCTHREFIAHLEGEIAWLKIAMQHERQRAERAIDELLRLKVGAGPVTVPLMPDVTPESQMERMLADPEFTNVGA